MTSDGHAPGADANDVTVFGQPRRPAPIMVRSSGLREPDAEGRRGPRPTPLGPVLTLVRGAKALTIGAGVGAAMNLGLCAILGMLAEAVFGGFGLVDRLARAALAMALFVGIGVAIVEPIRVAWERWLLTRAAERVAEQQRPLDSEISLIRRGPVPIMRAWRFSVGLTLALPAVVLFFVGIASMRRTGDDDDPVTVTIWGGVASVLAIGMVVLGWRAARWRAPWRARVDRLASRLPRLLREATLPVPRRVSVGGMTLALLLFLFWTSVPVLYLISESGALDGLAETATLAFAIGFGAVSVIGFGLAGAIEAMRCGWGVRSVSLSAATRPGRRVSTRPGCTSTRSCSLRGRSAPPPSSRAPSPSATSRPRRRVRTGTPSPSSPRSLRRGASSGRLPGSRWCWA